MRQRSHPRRPSTGDTRNSRRSLDRLTSPQTNPKRNKVFGVPSRLMIVLVVGAGLWMFWTQLLYPTNSVRYRLTVEVQTPSGKKTGSSVIEARYGFEPTLFGMISGVTSSLVGEAVFIDLDSGKNVVVTLINRHSGGDIRETPSDRRPLNGLSLPSEVYDFPAYDRQKTPKGIARAKSFGPKMFHVERLPLIVTFADIRNPKSVTRVDPTNLDDHFGPGYSISSAAIEIVDEPPTQKIVQELKWLKQLHDAGERLNGSTSIAISSSKLVDELGVGDFKVGAWE